MIVDQLKSHRTDVDVKNRAMFIDDAFAPTSASMDMSQVRAMRTTEYLDDETEYIPWKTALTCMDNVDLMLSRDATNADLFSTYMLNRTDLLYNTYGWHVSEDQTDHLLTNLRIEATSTACKYSNTECLAEALLEFQQWQESVTAGTQNPIAVDYRSIVYCNGIKAGSDLEWQLTWDTFVDNKSPQDRSNLLYGLSCSTEEDILNKNLELALNDANLENKDDAYRMMYYTALNFAGRDLTWEFVQTNFIAINKRIEQARLDSVVTAITTGFNTDTELEDVKKFRENPGAVDSEFKEMWDAAEERVEANIVYMANNEAELVQWLTDINAGTRDAFGNVL
ncbi:PREDICTED: aminopeptidase N-like [Priapulus caudatus]|uniref:Aminopeptidase N-like n=1 Tax=Priapulus caudatus TaxID=37621 RepID=A0ABM1DXV2_PRICU|nr:PREDICTED: aminopeptidase N-like [Priapulus caudatus]